MMNLSLFSKIERHDETKEIDNFPLVDKVTFQDYSSTKT